MRNRADHGSRSGEPTAPLVSGRGRGGSRGAIVSGLILAMCSCSGGGGVGELSGGGSVYLASVHQGKLVDVYGFRTQGGAKLVELFQADVLVSVEIQDERAPGSDKSDDEVTYDFISPNPDTLQPHLLITREIGTPQFRSAFEALDDLISLVSPSQFGADTTNAPYPVIARNAALRLTFSGDLGITDDFFYARDDKGRISAYKNREAVQLLQIVGDPNDATLDGDFEVIDARLSVRGNTIIVDPVLLGAEGLIYGSRNSASGLPASPDQKQANIRLAVALEGPLSVRNVSEDPFGNLQGFNNGGFPSVIRDFRAGQELDSSANISRGFIRDRQRPTILGQMLTFIDEVETDPVTKNTVLRIFKNGTRHEIDRGDVLRIFDPASTTGIPVESLEVVLDPVGDLGKPGVQRVEVQVRPVLRDDGAGGMVNVLEEFDPDNPGYGAGLNIPDPIPALDQNDPVKLEARNAWLRQWGSRAVLVAEYTHRRRHPAPTGSSFFYGDDPRYFIGFSPSPLAGVDGVIVGNENVSPFADAVVRFSKPVDMATVVALDTAFFATRNLLDSEEIGQFIADFEIEPTQFNEAKFRTPHLIHSRIFDEDGSQTRLRLQPSMGFYLDEAMRKAAKVDRDSGLSFEERRYHYFLHIVGGFNGITDLSGNRIDFQAVDAPGEPQIDHLVMEFSLDTNYEVGADLTSPRPAPRYDDNIAVYVVRRYADKDEDEYPNLYIRDERPIAGEVLASTAWPSNDVFGPVSYLATGELVARSASRLTKVFDDRNQLPAPPQSSELRWCPAVIEGGVGFGGGSQVALQLASTVFNQPIQNPLNPAGSRQQMVWREIDMGLSRTDPQDYNLDVEQMYWAPFAGNPIAFDQFDRVSLFLGHSEYRPEACVGGGGFPSLPSSGLKKDFGLNYAHNIRVDGNVGHKPQMHPAYVDRVLTISSTDVVLEANGVNRYLPLPKFQDATVASNLKNPYFVWRDEQEIVQGGDPEFDVVDGNPVKTTPDPALLSPFMGGRGRSVVANTLGNLTFVRGGWYSGGNVHLSNGNRDKLTGGMIGTIGLPLLADFWTYADSEQLPVEDPFIATGFNGWQVSLGGTVAPQPSFRAFSWGRPSPPRTTIGPSDPDWVRASGGGDNTAFWMMADLIKRTAVVTSGFVDIFNPHRMPAGVDPRLGPYDTPLNDLGGSVPEYSYEFEPPLSSMPPGTTVIPEFRGAAALAHTVGKASVYWPKFDGPGYSGNDTNETNFSLDPLKAGDAHIRHFDNRFGRDWWTFLYNETVTTYTVDPSDLSSSVFATQFSSPAQAFESTDIKYFNWRFIMKNNIQADPPISPKIESFSVAYRFPGR